MRAQLASPRTWAFCILAADAMLDAHPGHEMATTMLRDLSPPAGPN